MDMGVFFIISMSSTLKDNVTAKTNGFVLNTVSETKIHDLNP